jgi:hypothetical protein
MSLVKENDVKNLASQGPKGIHLVSPVSKSNAAGLSGDRSPRPETNGEKRIQQASVNALDTPVTSPGTETSIAPTSPKSAQA